jgi:hypothetical protein
MLFISGIHRYGMILGEAVASPAFRALIDLVAIVVRFVIVFNNPYFEYYTVDQDKYKSQNPLFQSSFRFS